MMWWFENTVQTFKGLNLTELNIDEAWLNISSSLDEPVWLYILSDDCHYCPFQKLLNDPILPNHSYKTVINVSHGSTLRIRTIGNSTLVNAADDSFKICDIRRSLGEFGVYSIHVGELASSQCSFETNLEPVNIFLSLAFILICWMLIGALLVNYGKEFASTIQSLLYHCREVWYPEVSQAEGSPPEDRKTRNQSASETSRRLGESNDRRGLLTSNDSITAESSGSCNPNVDQPPHSFKRERMKSLDAFRGLCIVIMIIANGGGGGYYFFRHSSWDGLYVADVAFPWFLWICGVCIPFSINAKLASGVSKGSIFVEITKRSLKLILLGIMVNTSSSQKAVQLENLRLPAVLVRFGVCYLIGSTLFLYACKTGSRQHSQQSSTLTHTNWSARFEDLRITFLPWMITILCVVIHTVLVFTLPVPGCPTGYLGPAGLHNNNEFSPQCVGGAYGYVDRLIFGLNHMSGWPTSKKVYGSGAFDPEGTLGTLTSVFHIWLGVQTGVTLIVYRSAASRLWRLAVWSVLCGAGGMILCGGIQNEGWIPMNKNLWSLSFVLTTSSLALAALIILYILIDVYSLWSGSPLMETGMNSILLYLGHEICHAMLPWNYAYGRMQTHFSQLFETTWGTFLWVIIACQLYQRKIFFVV